MATKNEAQQTSVKTEHSDSANIKIKVRIKTMKQKHALKVKPEVGAVNNAKKNVPKLGTTCRVRNLVSSMTTIKLASVALVAKTRGGAPMITQGAKMSKNNGKGTAL